MSDPMDISRIYARILQSLYLDDTHSDLDILAEDGTRFRVHKCILSAASEYFNGMFSGSFIESNQAEIRLSDVTAKTLDVILKLIYGFHVEFSSLKDEEEVVDVLKAANILQIDFITDFCWGHLVKEVTLENCWTLLLLSDLLMKKTVYEEVIGFIGTHLKHFWKSKVLMEVDVDTIEKILKSNGLKVQSEEDVFFLMVAWINHDMEARFKFCPRLLKAIRLHLLSSKFVAENIKPLAIDEENKRIIEEALLWLGQSGADRSLEGVNIIPRKTIKNKIIAVVPYCKTISVHGYCSVAKIWTTDILKMELAFKPKVLGLWKDSLMLFNEKANRIHVLPMDGDLLPGIELARRSNFSASTWRMYCYVVGGMRIEAVRTVQKYNFNTGVWIGMPSLNEAKQCPATIITATGILYALGGGSYERAEPSCECLNLAEKAEEWIHIAPMPLGRFAPQVVECKGNLFIFGGYTIIDQECCLSTVQKYNPIAKEWTVLGNLQLESLIRISVATYEDHIFLLAVDHKRRSSFGQFNEETCSFEEILGAKAMEDIDHKFHAAQMFFVQ